MVTILLFFKFICTGNYLLLTGHRVCHYLMERIMALQQMIDKKIHIFICLIDFVQFLPRTNKFCPRHL